MSIGPVIMELRYEEDEKSSLENSKIGVTKKITDFSKLNCPTSSYHNSTNTGPIDMFFTKKCNYFSWENCRGLRGCLLKNLSDLNWNRNCIDIMMRERSRICQVFNTFIWFFLNLMPLLCLFFPQNLDDFQSIFLSLFPWKN